MRYQGYFMAFFSVLSLNDTSSVIIGVFSLGRFLTCSNFDLLGVFFSSSDAIYLLIFWAILIMHCDYFRCAAMFTARYFPFVLWRIDLISHDFSLFVQ
jgi:hypothetical protein